MRNVQCEGLLYLLMGKQIKELNNRLEMLLRRAKLKRLQLIAQSLEQEKGYSKKPVLNLDADSKAHTYRRLG